jgi:hypothetical protein
MIDGCPAKRAGAPDEVGNVAALLLGKEGPFITGCDSLRMAASPHPIGWESWLRSDRTSQCGSPCLFGHPGKDRAGRSGHPHWAEGVPSFIPDWWKNGAPGKVKMRELFALGCSAAKPVEKSSLTASEIVRSSRTGMNVSGQMSSTGRFQSA